MKHFLRSLALVMSLVGSGLVLPATAQTPLLEIDYNGATIFHVFDDGRLLLPAGAQDGYVLTATDDGFASWQAVSASGGVVASNGTLSGDGTPGNPLGVAVPLHLSGGTGSGGTIYGEHSQGHRGLLGGASSGVFGLHSSGNTGELGSSAY
ncbi:MAG TPA: hypothetical protein VKP65_20000, partial [Rhodothermales bacterium]|nr:hypothetical protein [Rhodothermales bacterium]